jgi:branched-subunit amino acid ABC-type transport system permease component
MGERIVQVFVVIVIGGIGSNPRRSPAAIIVGMVDTLGARFSSRRSRRCSPVGRRRPGRRSPRC